MWFEVHPEDQGGLFSGCMHDSTHYVTSLEYAHIYPAGIRFFYLSNKNIAYHKCGPEKDEEKQVHCCVSIEFLRL